MRTRNAGTPKTPPASQKKTASAKKSAAKTPPSAAAATSSPSVDELTPVTTPASVATPSSEGEATPVSDSAGEQVKPSTEDAAVATKVAAAPKKKVTRKVIKKVLRPKVPASAKAGSAVKVAEAEDVKGDEELKDVDMTDVKTEQSLKAEEVVVKATDTTVQAELGTQRPEDLVVAEEKGKAKMDVDDSTSADTVINAETEAPAVEGVSKSAEEPSECIEAPEEKPVEEPIKEVNVAAAAEPFDTEKEPQVQPDNVEDQPDNVDDQPDNVDDDQKLENIGDVQKPENTDADHLEKVEEASQMKEDDVPVEEAAHLKEDDAPVSEEYGDEEGFVEPGDEDLREDDEPETTDDTKAIDEEHKELAAAAKERKIKKEHEIFVGGLDSEVSEDDVKKAFENAGEVVEVRLLKDPTTNKNRGFAFVRFSTKEQAKKALSEMKNPVICGKRCGTAPNEDNDTLFVGNICNTWTKEAIKQKLKDYDVEGVESITLVQDPRQEGLSRGFCFIQFACHADAMSAYKRLQKPDAVFGHAERTAKVAFAEPLQEPDPEVMAKVKSIFVDGLPPFWDEDRVRKHFKSYGEIERVTLARNMSTAKRKDFGFVDYMTHEAAVACIEDVNKKELLDGNSKIKVRARLSNPSPKMQAVKGGMCGGFRIGRPTGRSLGRPGPPVNRPNFQYNRVSRGPFNDPVGPHGRRGPHRGGHSAPGAYAPVRPIFDGPRHGFIDRGPVRPVPPHREPYPLYDGGYSRSFMGRHYDDTYMYGDSHGLKRPFYMTEPDPTYMEPSQVRPRFDYTGSGRGSHFRDTFGAGSSLYSSSYYAADYNARPHPSFNGRDRGYGSGSGSGSGSGRGRGSGRGSGRGTGRSSGSGSGYYY